jgi:hypothetical protein
MGKKGARRVYVFTLWQDFGDGLSSPFDPKWEYHRTVVGSKTHWSPYFVLGNIKVNFEERTFDAYMSQKAEKALHFDRKSED